MDKVGKNNLSKREKNKSSVILECLRNSCDKLINEISWAERAKETRLEEKKVKSVG